MSKKVITNIADSMRQRLLNLSRERREDFTYLLNRFALERFLYRFSQSRYADSFILKGAFLFFLWSTEPHRPTKDIDFLSLKHESMENIEQFFKEISDIQASDGLEFRRDSVLAEAIRENQSEGGIRVFVAGSMTSARFRLQFDIGFGDSVTPDASVVEIPSLLDLPSPRMKIYPKETLIAEKYEALVKRGIANSRMKDFYDLWYLSHNFRFDGSTLAMAVENTFKRRKTAFPESVPIALTGEFAQDTDKRKQWKAFTGTRGFRQETPVFNDIIARLKVFLMPPTEALAARQPFDRQWSPEQGWQDKSSCKYDKLLSHQSHPSINAPHNTSP